MTPGRTTAAAALALVVLASGCGSSPSPAAAPPSRAEPASRTALIWMTRSGRLHPVARRIGSGLRARATLRALLDGPTDAERSSGVRTAIPAGTRLLSLEVTGRTATVNLGERFAAQAGDTPGTVLRLAQVVYTLTADAGIDRVQIEISGRPLRDGQRREDYRGLI